MNANRLGWLGVGMAVGAACAAALALVWNEGGDDALTEADVAQLALYTCGMHPEVVRDEPGNCPICGMRLVPKHDDHGADDATVSVSKSFRQNFAAPTAPVQRTDLPINIDTVGILAHNEERIHAVNTKFPGWIVQANAHHVGDFVARGQPLFQAYSQQLVTTGRELAAAADYASGLADAGASVDAVARAKALVIAARQRLRSWDLKDDDINALVENLTSAAAVEQYTVTFRAPVSGLVVSKLGDALDGTQLQAGVTVLKIADHTSLWAETSFDEEDLRHVRLGSGATVSSAAFPGRQWQGTLRLLRSALDGRSRTLTGLVEVNNPDLALRPGMYVDVRAHVAPVADALVVPSGAVLASGKRDRVVVQRPDGSFEPRTVTVGVRAGELAQILDGLSAGERVVASAQFLIASESDLEAASRQLTRGDDAPLAHHNHSHH